MPKNQDFYDYTAWMRQEPARSLFENAFKNPSAQYSEFLDQVFTLEIWLQQLASKSVLH
jgi:hypothetical protein